MHDKGSRCWSNTSIQLHTDAYPAWGYARDTDLVRRAESHGLAPAALSPLSINRDCGQGLLLSFTNIPEERASELAGVLRVQSEFSSIATLSNLGIR
jgi:hypothetical protein